MKGVIVQLKDEYTYVLTKDARIKKIKRTFNHEIGMEIEINQFSYKRIIPIVFISCLIVVAFTLSPLKNGTNNVEASELGYISLSINPDIIFKIDNDLKVIDVTYTNSDANAVIENIDFVNQSLYQGVINFIDYCYDKNYLNEQSDITVNVISENEEDISRLETIINSAIESYMNEINLSVSLSIDEVSNSQSLCADELGITETKLKLIDLIIEYNSYYTREELASEDIDDLLELLEDYGLDEDLLEHLEDQIEDIDEDDD